MQQIACTVDTHYYTKTEKKDLPENVYWETKRKAKLMIKKCY